MDTQILKKVWYLLKQSSDFNVTFLTSQMSITAFRQRQKLMDTA